jgi:hypothetical protein
MSNAKCTIHLTDDNWADYFGNIFAESLVEGTTAGEDGVEVDGPLVDRLLRWLARKNKRLTRQRRRNRKMSSIGATASN